jgi:hypothetical protein
MTELAADAGGLAGRWLIGRWAAAIGGLALTVACVPVQDGQWFTPAGVPLGEIDCISPAPLTGTMGREICKARLIPEVPKEIALCEGQGGAVGPVSVVDGRFACLYRKTGPDADGGSDSDGRTDNRTGTKA